MVGSPLYMDEQTLRKKGHEFARVCIMISAESRLVDSVKILRENGKEFEQLVCNEWRPPHSLLEIQGLWTL